MLHDESRTYAVKPACQSSRSGENQVEVSVDVLSPDITDEGALGLMG